MRFPADCAEEVIDASEKNATATVFEAGSGGGGSGGGFRLYRFCRFGRGSERRT
jgi:hypothetical protein